MKRLLLLLILAMPLFGQQDDPIGKNLIPPDVVMTNAEKIGLTDKQRATIKSEVQKAQTKFIDVQFDLQEATGKMAALLQQTPIDETKVLEQADRIMSLEREMKRTQLTLMVRIKNALTADQIGRLQVLKRELHQ